MKNELYNMLNTIFFNNHEKNQNSTNLSEMEEKGRKEQKPFYIAKGRI